MKALILAGGLGTRLRPLTFSMPKPVIPLLGRPLVRHLIDPLPEEVDTVILAVSYMKDYLERYFRENDIGRVVLVNEEEPLGTGSYQARRSLAGRHLLRVQRRHNIIFDLSAMLGPQVPPWHRDNRPGSADEFQPGSGHRWFRSVTTFRKSRPWKRSQSHQCRRIYSNRNCWTAYPTGSCPWADVFPNVLDRGLYGYTFQGYWVDAGTRESFLRARRTC